MTMMSNGGGGGAGDGKGNNGGGRKRDHEQVEVEEDHEALLRIFPTGYRFKPTDEELIKHYLYRKVNKLRLPPNLIKDVNIYEFHPKDLSGRYRSHGDNEFYFFTPRERKYRNGIRPNRAANGGYWKASGTDDPVVDTKTNEEIGFRRSLSFFRGKPPKSDSKKAENLRDNKTDWLMHEYTLEKLKDQQKGKGPFTDVDSSSHKQLNEFILCKLYKKHGKSKKHIKYTGHDKAVDATPPSSIANATSSAAVVLPEDHHQRHQNTVVVAAAATVVGDYQYSLTSRAATAAATAEGMGAEYQHYMCQTDVTKMGMMSFNYNCNYLDNGNLSFSSAPSSAILPSVSQHHYGEMDQHRLQPAVLPSVNHQYYNGEMNQHRLQPAVLPSVNHRYYNVEMSQQQLQPAILPSVNQHGQMNQQQLQSAVLPLVNQHMNGQMNQQQLDKNYVLEVFMADLKNISFQPNIVVYSPPDLGTDIDPR